MATRKRVKRNIKEDQLVTVAVRLSRWGQEHFTQVMIGVAALVILVGGLVYTAYNRRSQGQEAQRQLSGALGLYQMGEYAAARTSLEQVVQRFSGRPAAIARYFKAECELLQGEFAQALESFDAYVDDPGEGAAFIVPAMYGKGVCQSGLQDYAAAANTMVELLARLEPGDPRYLDAAFQAGEFFAKAGDAEQAVRYLNEVAEKGTGPLKERAIVSVALMTE